MSASPPINPNAERTAHGQVLDEVLRKTPELEGLLILTTTGEVTDVAGEHEERLRQLASFAIGAFELSTRLANEAGRGDVNFHLVRSERGHLVLHRIGDDKLLFGVAAEEAPLGLLAHDLGWCAGRLAARS
jgi:predicted regulator of Ras-like GTPase activity (Roadblock/LC7/MglB family)